MQKAKKEVAGYGVREKIMSQIMCGLVSHYDESSNPCRPLETLASGGFNFFNSFIEI